MEAGHTNIIDIIAKLKHTLENHRDKMVFAYLFGSLAEGSEGPMSDVDVAVFLADDCVPSHWDVKLFLHGDLCRALRRNDVDVVILNRTRNLILLDAIIRRGIVLLDRNPDLREDFELKILHRAIDFRAQRAAMMGL